VNKNAQRRPTLVLPDSNILRTERFFSSTNGAALLQLLNRSGAKILLPEVIEIEVIPVLVSLYAAELKKAKSRISSLEALLGSDLGTKFPTEADFQRAIRKSMTGLEGFIVRAPFTLEIARSALIRVVEKRPPSGSNNEQFRDCCIWQHCLEYGQKNTVHLISADGDFTKKKDALMSEAKSQGADIRLHATVGEFLGYFEPTVKHHNDERAHQIDKVLKPLLSQYAQEAGFYIGDLKESNIAIPEDTSASNLATFEMKYSLSDPQPSSVRIDPVLQANGIFTLQADGAVMDPQVEDHRIEWTNRNGASEEYRVFANTASQPLPFGWQNNSWEVAAQIAARRPFNPAIFAPSMTGDTPLPLKISDTQAKSE
jgi:PIN domain